MPGTTLKSLRISYIKTDKNKYLLYVEGDRQAKSPWGFYLTDGLRTWDGGVDCPLLRSKNWEYIKYASIPPSYTKIRQELSDAKTWLETGYSCARLQAGIFEPPY